NRNLFQFILNSIGVSVAITIAKTILSLLAGLAFIYFRFPGKWVVFAFVLITLMMPTEVLILALLRFVSDLGWGNTYLALVVSFGPLMLGAVIATMPPVIVFILLQKQFMSGFALTRDK